MGASLYIKSNFWGHKKLTFAGEKRICVFGFVLLFIATNGFSESIIQEKVVPARAQVLITKPIKNLNVIGTFHFQQGYYYFRNIDDRILLGGGRNLDFHIENTNQFGVTDTIQSKLEQLLTDVILPQSNFEIEQRWSGIMGIGNKKNTITKNSLINWNEDDFSNVTKLWVSPFHNFSFSYFLIKVTVNR